MTEIRCKKCNRLLMKMEEQTGPVKGQCIIECKCSKCGYLNKVNAITFNVN